MGRFQVHHLKVGHAKVIPVGRVQASFPIQKFTHMHLKNIGQLDAKSALTAEKFCWGARLPRENSLTYTPSRVKDGWPARPEHKLRITFQKYGQAHIIKQKVQ